MKRIITRTAFITSSAHYSAIRKAERILKNESEHRATRDFLSPGRQLRFSVFITLFFRYAVEPLNEGLYIPLRGALYQDPTVLA